MPFEDTLGTQRSRSIYQLIGLLYLFTIWPFVLAVGVIGGAVFYLSNVVIGVIWNRDVSSGSVFGLAGIGARLWDWPFDQLGYIVREQPATFRFLP